MNRTTTVVVALIAAAGLSTMAYTVPEQRAFAWGGFGGFGGFGGCGGWGGCGGFGGCGGWGGCGGFGGCGGWGGCGGGFFDGCGFGCGGGFFVHKHIIQTIHQVNNCTSGQEEKKQKDNWSGDDENDKQKDKQVVCLNTAVNSAGRGFGGNGDGLDGGNRA